MKLAKNIFLSLALFSLLVVPAVSSAQPVNYYDENDPFGYNQPQEFGLGTADLRDTIINIVQLALSFLGLLAVIIILWGGFQWLTAGGNEDKVGNARKTIIAGLIGLVIILSAYAIASFVIGQLTVVTEGGL